MPPKNETNALIKNSKASTFPDCKIVTASKPKRAKDFIKNMLPKTPAIVFPIKSNEYFLKRKGVRFAPMIPIKILIKESKVAVIL